MAPKVLEATYDAGVNEYRFRVWCDDSKTLPDGNPNPRYVCERSFDGAAEVATPAVLDEEGNETLPAVLETIAQVRTRLRAEMRVCATEHATAVTASLNAVSGRQSLGLDGKAL